MLKYSYLDTGLTNGSELMLENVHKLTLGHPVPVDDDPVGLVAAGGLVEHDEVLLHHSAKLLDDLLPVLLDPDGGRVPAGVRVLATNHRGDAGLLVVPGRGVGHVRAEEDDWLIEYLWSDGGQQDGVDSAQLDIDFETQVGEGLGRCLVDILGLDTLSGHPKHSVTDSLDLGIDRGLAGQHHHDQLESGEGGLEISEHRLHLVRPGGVFAEDWLANDGHPRVIGNLLKLLSEVPEGVLPHCPAGSEAGDGPLSDLHPCEELFASHVPDTLVRQRLLLGAASVL